MNSKNNPIEPNTPSTEELATEFRRVRDSHEDESHALEALEQALETSNFDRAHEYDVAQILQSNALFCRSENFSRVVELLTRGIPIELRSKGYQANMCIMASGEGFRTAMLEGFSGSDVGGMVKAVMVFDGSHLDSHATIPIDKELWETKPETARLSLSGEGQVLLDDIKMLSFRFPISYFPNNLLTEVEKEQLEDGEIHFVVRHYIPKKKTTQ